MVGQTVDNFKDVGRYMGQIMTVLAVTLDILSSVGRNMKTTNFCVGRIRGNVGRI